jgi:hypothetical protein
MQYDTLIADLEYLIRDFLAQYELGAKHNQKREQDLEMKMRRAKEDAKHFARMVTDADDDEDAREAKEVSEYHRRTADDCEMALAGGDGMIWIPDLARAFYRVYLGIRGEYHVSVGKYYTILGRFFLDLDALVPGLEANCRNLLPSEPKMSGAIRSLRYITTRLSKLRAVQNGNSAASPAETDEGDDAPAPGPRRNKRGEPSKPRGRPLTYTDNKLQLMQKQYGVEYRALKDSKAAWNKVAESHGCPSGDAARIACSKHRKKKVKSST